MSTRSAVALGTPEKWSGLYCHWDGYPTYRGPQVWAMIQAGTLTRDFIQAHPGGFSSFPDECYCHSPTFAPRDGSAAPDSPYYDPTQQPETVSSESPDPLSIEWVYIYDALKKRLYVLVSHACKDRTHTARATSEHPYLAPDGTTYYWHCTYRHVRVASVRTNGPEPDWGKIEARGLKT